MKTTLLFILALVVGVTVSAQKAGYIPSNHADRTLPASVKPIMLEYTNPSKIIKSNAGPKTDHVLEDIIGTTTYDLQSNATIQNRLYVYPDHTMVGVWTMGFETGTGNTYVDRGTGYNYYDGTSWGDAPTARIESVRTGWPSYAPLGDGEMVISHQSSGNLKFSSRPTRGTGAWTTVDVPNTSGYAWPRAITSGNTIHLIANTYVAYNGLTNAIVYLRSTDKGATWSAPALLPGMDAASFTINSRFDGFGGDEYAWAAPHGDTIAFGFGDVLGGLWVMKSLDNGDTWTRTTVYDFPNFTAADNPRCATYDEIFAVALDNQAKIHLVTTRYMMIHLDATANPVSWNYYPETDGIIYWNEDMPKIDTSIYNEPDSLISHGMWLGNVQDLNGNDIIDYQDAGSGNQPWGEYRYVGPSSFPQIVIDNNNNMFVSYSALREDLYNASSNPTVQHYRHLYVTSKLNGQTDWSDPIDINDNIEHSYDEVVWANMVNGNDGLLHFLCQIDAEPGTSIGADADAALENNITHITFPTFVSTKPVDIAKDVTIFPNPVHDFANVLVSLQDSKNVELNVFDAMGKLVYSSNLGMQASGPHSYRVNTASLNSGIYLFNVKIGNSHTSKKVVVN